MKECNRCKIPPQTCRHEVADKDGDIDPFQVQADLIDQQREYPENISPHHEAFGAVIAACQECQRTLIMKKLEEITVWLQSQ